MEKRDSEYILGLEYYLWDLGADKEERRCTRMWVRDGHDINDNDHPDMPDWMDFLTAARIAQSKESYSNYTDSFYDPLTQEYIRSLNPTRSEMKKLRDHIRNGGRFTVMHNFAGEIDYISLLRNRKLYQAEEFDSYFQEWIKKYGAEYLVRRNHEWDFVRFLEEKADYISFRTGSGISEGAESSQSATMAPYYVQYSDTVFEIAEDWDNG